MRLHLTMFVNVSEWQGCGRDGVPSHSHSAIFSIIQFINGKIGHEDQKKIYIYAHVAQMNAYKIEAGEDNHDHVTVNWDKWGGLC